MSKTCVSLALYAKRQDPLYSLPILKNPFQRLAMDIFGPLKKTQIGNKYILVAMDYTTKWPEAFALKNVTA